jgi:hypothetical protein
MLALVSMQRDWPKHLAYALAAAVAALWGVFYQYESLKTLGGEHVGEASRLTLILILVGGYIFKDRIKDIGKEKLWVYLRQISGRGQYRLKTLYGDQIGKVSRESLLLQVNQERVGCSSQKYMISDRFTFEPTVTSSRAFHGITSTLRIDFSFLEPYMDHKPKRFYVLDDQLRSRMVEEKKSYCVRIEIAIYDEKKGEIIEVQEFIVTLCSNRITQLQRLENTGDIGLKKVV